VEPEPEPQAAEQVDREQLKRLQAWVIMEHPQEAAVAAEKLMITQVAVAVAVKLNSPIAVLTQVA
jgi:hypothetical protein